MSLESWLEITIAFVALVLLALAGVADFSLNRKQRISVREWLEGGAAAQNGENPVEQAALVRLSLMSVMLVAAVVVAVMAAMIGSREFGGGGALIGLGSGLIAIAFFARGLPQALSDRYDLSDSEGIERLTQALLTIAAPVVWFIELCSRLVVMLVGGRADERRNGMNTARTSNGEDPAPMDEEEIDNDEHEMISGILAMDEATAREIMVPRPDVISVAIDTPLPEVVEIVQQAGHSRIPVYEGTIDSIRGIVYAKDLLRFVGQDASSFSLQQIMRPAVFVPESKRVDNLLADLRRSRVHIAVVVDEYGGTAGIVTIEDILEEIVGEIQDEYDRERPLYEFGTSGEITVDGRMPIDELAELIGVRLPESDSETLGGFVQQQLGRIPEVGERVSTDVVTIEVEEVEGRRVRALCVRMNDQESPGAARPVGVS